MSFERVSTDTSCRFSILIAVYWPLKIIYRITIPILYLPKTRPSLPPVLDLAPQYSAENSLDTERVLVIDMSTPESAEYLHQSMVQVSLFHTFRWDFAHTLAQFAMPNPGIFAAGEFIPLTLVVSCSRDLTLPQLLLNNKCITIKLVKQSKIWFKSGWVTRHTVVSMAELQHLDSSSEGVSQSHWVLQAGRPQQEATLQMPCALSISVSPAQR
jgi:hypothetical protein